MRPCTNLLSLRLLWKKVSVASTAKRKTWSANRLYFFCDKQKFSNWVRTKLRIPNIQSCTLENEMIFSTKHWSMLELFLTCVQGLMWEILNFVRTQFASHFLKIMSVSQFHLKPTELHGTLCMQSHSVMVEHESSKLSFCLRNYYEKTFSFFYFKKYARKKVKQRSP